ncbi:MAG: glutamate ligase domain-containing protein [Eggerthella lenta]
MLNAAGVVGLLWALGYDPAQAAEALADFAGVKRRFDLVGEAGGVTVVDDYAHHPTEIAATIEAASHLGFAHVHVLFQPHRYSRAPLFTEVLKDDFAGRSTRPTPSRSWTCVPGGRGARARRERQDVPERGARPCGPSRGRLRAAPYRGGALSRRQAGRGRPVDHHGRGRRDRHRPAARRRAFAGGRRRRATAGVMRR